MVGCGLVLIIEILGTQFRLKAVNSGKLIDAGIERHSVGVTRLLKYSINIIP